MQHVTECQKNVKFHTLYSIYLMILADKYEKSRIQFDIQSDI